MAGSTSSSESDSDNDDSPTLSAVTAKASKTEGACSDDSSLRTALCTNPQLPLALASTSAAPPVPAIIEPAAMPVVTSDEDPSQNSTIATIPVLRIPSPSFPIATSISSSDYPPAPSTAPTVIESAATPVVTSDEDPSQNSTISTTLALRSPSPSSLLEPKIIPSEDPPASTVTTKTAVTAPVVTSDDDPSQISAIDSTNLLLSPPSTSPPPSPVVTPNTPPASSSPPPTITTMVTKKSPPATLEQNVQKITEAASSMSSADPKPVITTIRRLDPSPSPSTLLPTVAPEPQTTITLSTLQQISPPPTTAPILPPPKATKTTTPILAAPLSPSPSPLKIDNIENHIKIESIKDSFKEDSYKISNIEYPTKPSPNPKTTADDGATIADFANDHDSSTSHNHLHLPIHLPSNLSSTALLPNLDHHLDDDDGNILGCHHSCASGANEHNQHHEDHSHNGLIHDPNNPKNIHPSKYTYDSHHLPLPPIINHSHHDRKENGSTTSALLDHDGNSTGHHSHNDHKSLLDAILNNNNSHSRMPQARDRAESWGGMSDLSHAAAIISAGTTIGGASTSIIGHGGGLGINCTTSVDRLGEVVANGSGSPIRGRMSDGGMEIGGDEEMRPASPPSVAASFEVFLSSPKSMNTISGCGISLDANTAIAESNPIVGVGFGVNVGDSNVNNMLVGDDGGSNGSLGIAALEADLISDCPPKIGFGVPVKIAVPERRNRSNTAADLESLELDLEKEEEAMMAKGISELTNNNNTKLDTTTGYWRERLDSISMGSIFNRDRIDSMSSLPPSRKDSFAAAASLSGVVTNLTRERFESITSFGDCSMNMSITDLADVAGALESVVAQSVVDGDGVTKSVACKMEEDDADSSNKASFPPPTIQVDPDAVQAAVQAAMAATPGSIYDMLKIGTAESAPATSSKQRQQQQQQKQQKKPAANAPSTAAPPKARIKIEPVRQVELPPPLPSCNMKINTSVKKPTFRLLPPKVKPTLPDSSLPRPPTSTATSTSEKEMEAIRARARAAAGYVPPSGNIKPGSTPQSSLKRRLNHPHLNRNTNPNGLNYSTTNKRPKTNGAGRILSSPTATLSSTTYSTTKTTLPTGVVHLCASNFTTPKRSNTKKATKNKNQSNSALITLASATKNSSKGQSEQKWEEMYQCLVAYVEEQKEKETRGMTKEEAAEHLTTWEWSGNVPTMYKRKDGKALGRWINNQRSAKSKGTLKMDREVRLVSTGLKWSVLTTNAWTDMMEELRIYVREQTKNGGGWNGNVPTNYKIKNNMANDGSEIDEDKNLGRWINRQRSLYQADKLKKERQIELEKVGLKWAVLSTTSWHAMYDTLCKYAQERRDADKNSYWDGNVPASHETDDKPPKRLGRWVNRQRSAYATDKLKKEFVVKLEKIGLKWTAHDKKLLSKITSENDGETIALKVEDSRVITPGTNTVLLNGKKINGGQHPIIKQGPEPSLFLNGKGHNPISAPKLPPKLPVVTALTHKNISNAKTGNSAVIIGL